MTGTLVQNGVGYCWQDEYWTTGTPSMPQCNTSEDCGGEYCIYPCFDAAGNGYPQTQCAISGPAVSPSAAIDLPEGYTSTGATAICHAQI